MKILILSHTEVSELLPIKECIPLMREALIALASGRVHQPLRTIIRPPDANWSEHAEKRTALNRIGSPLDPYASFLDIRELKKLAGANAKVTGNVKGDTVDVKSVAPGA